jgi:hypothetical protein
MAGPDGFISCGESYAESSMAVGEIFLMLDENLPEREYEALLDAV